MPIDERLRPKDEIPEDARTDGRDDAFEALEELREKGEFAGKSYPELAEVTGWSKPHLRNVVEGYYTIPSEESDADEGGESKDGESEREPESESDSEREAVSAADFGSNGEGETVEIAIPAGCDREVYLRGWMDGYLRKENPA